MPHSGSMGSSGGGLLLCHAASEQWVEMVVAAWVPMPATLHPMWNHFDPLQETVADPCVTTFLTNSF